MAISNTDKTNALTGVTTYAATIAGQTARIADAHEIIQAKAIDLGLQIQAGEGDAKPASKTDLTDSHKIMDTASAINSIAKNPSNAAQDITLVMSGNQVAIADGASVTINPGYYTPEQTIQVQGNLTLTGATTAALSLTGSHTAGANSVTVSTNGTRITAAGYISTTSNKAASKTVNLVASSKTDNPLTVGTVEKTENSQKVNYLTLTPAQGFYTNDAWTTNIKYAPLSGEQTVKVVESTSTGETLVEGFTVPAGYYPNAITVKPLLENRSGDYVINIDTTVPELTAKSGKLPAVDTGYNYYASDADYTIKGGSITAVTASGPTATKNTVTFGGGVTTAGWISSNVTKPSTITLTNVSESTTEIASPYLTITPGTTAKYIPAATWTMGGVKINPISEGAKWEKSMSGPTKTTTAITSSGNNSGNVTANHYYVKLTVDTAGFAPTGNHYKDIGTGLSVATAASATSGVTYTDKGTIAGQTVYFNATGNYQASASYYKATVRSASGFNVADSTNVITPGDREGDATNGYYYPLTTSITGSFATSGWTAATNATYTDSSVTVGKIAAGNHSYGTIFKQAATENNLTKDHWYIPCTITAGYQTASTQHLDLGVGGSGATLTRTTTSKSIAAGTYYGAAATVSVSSVAGTLGDGAGTANNSANISTSSATNATAEATLRLENLQTNTTFYAAGNKFLSSFTVQVNDTIAALQAI